ncbi:hypothetical protein IAT38_005201 [Cryptococcus sp. DSM 104549]
MRTVFTSAVASSSKTPLVRPHPRQSLRLFTSTPIARDDGFSRDSDEGAGAKLAPKRKSFGLKAPPSEASFRPPASSAPSAPSASRLSWTERADRAQAKASSLDQLSSNLDNLHTPSPEERNHDFQNLFKLLRQKPTEHETPKKLPGKAMSMAARLQLSAEDSSPLPFSKNGPSLNAEATRFNRAGGVTPHEATAFNKVIADVLSTFPKPDRKPYGGPASPYRPGAYNALGRAKTPPSLANVGRERAANLRGIFGKLHKDDEATMEELDLLSEEMDIIGDDMELLHWAKERVFTPVRGGEKELAGESITMPVFPATTNTPSSASAEEPSLPPLLEYRLAYSKILARVLRTFRVHYNQPHLVLALFEHARTVSMESYMQGCTTEVYNEMLITRWECFRDLEGIFAATNEMDVMGVPWDQHTMQVVNAAVTTVSEEGMQPGNTRWSERELVISAQLDKQVEKDVVTEERFTAFARKQKDRLRYEMGASALPPALEVDAEGYEIDPLAALGTEADKWSGSGPAGGKDRLEWGPDGPR